MDPIVLTGLALGSAALAVAYLAARRRYRGRLLVLAAAGWGLFFIGLAAAFQVLPYGPQLFLVGGIAGAILQRVTGEPRQITVQPENPRPSA